MHVIPAQGGTSSSVERWHCGQKDKKCETTFRMGQAMMIFMTV